MCSDDSQHPIKHYSDRFEGMCPDDCQDSMKHYIEGVECMCPLCLSRISKYFSERVECKCPDDRENSMQHCCKRAHQFSKALKNSIHDVFQSKYYNISLVI